MDAHGVVKEVASRCDSCLLSFSTGQDSIVCLDLLSKYFKRVHLVHFVPCNGLEINERPLRYYAKKYGCEYTTMLDPDICLMLRQKGIECPKYTREDAFGLVRNKTGIEWAAFGFLCGDSFTRAMWMRQVSGVDADGKRFYPLFRWTKKHVEAYTKAMKIKLPPQYTYGFREAGSLKGESLLFYKRNYPKDYEKIVSAYPFVKKEVLRLELQE